MIVEYFFFFLTYSMDNKYNYGEFIIVYNLRRNQFFTEHLLVV